MEDVDLEIERIEQELKEAKDLTLKFKEDIRSHIELNNKNKNYLRALKKSLKKMLDYRYNQSNNKDINFYNLVNFYLDTLDDETIYDNLYIFDMINFIDIKEERKLLEKIDLPLYINKLTGELVTLKNEDNNYISLKEFIDKGLYVGNKKVWLVNDDNENLAINLPYQDFIYYYDGIMLTFEHNLEGVDSFNFYPEKTLEIATNLKWEFSKKEDKLPPVADLFRNKEYTYQSIMDNYKKRLEIKEDISKKM